MNLSEHVRDQHDGESTYELFDARGIGCGLVCSLCVEQVKRKYRPEIFTDPDYWAAEDIEPDDGEDDLYYGPEGGGL